MVVGYKGKLGRLETTIDFAEGHSFRLSCPNFGNATLNTVLSYIVKYDLLLIGEPYFRIRACNLYALN